MHKRNLEYEAKFRSYLFSFDLENHKDICKNINVRPNQLALTYEEMDNEAEITGHWRKKFEDDRRRRDERA